jgi:sugar/nucleoside kinase (ribokinase family)
MITERPFDILVAGEINPDLILSGDVEPEFNQVEKLVNSASLEIGSSSVIFACGAARLGLRVSFVGISGQDVFGRFMLGEMQARSINISNVIIHPEAQTGLSVILNRGADRAIFTHLGLIDALRAEDLPDDLLSSARHLHVASYFLQTELQPGLPELFRRARSLGMTTSMDTNWDPSGKWIGLETLLPLVDVFLPNEREALALSRAESLGEAATILAKKASIVVIKRGADGGILRMGNTQIQSASIPVQVIDTVGAGDSFDAGFLYGYLHGWELEISLKLACICGALSTQAAGGTAAQPSLGEAASYLQQE